MTTQNNITNRPIDKALLTRYMLFGALVGLAIISTFVFGVDHPKPDWGSYWRIRPLIITPLSGAAAGAVFYFADYIGAQRGWPKALTIALSVVISITGLWMGVVLGLAGTMWN
jgi:hypothetical protein